MPKSHNQILADYEKFVEYTQKFPPEVAHQYLVAGLMSEIGEIAGVWKRLLRGDYEEYPALYSSKLLDEVGDVLWYITALSLHNGSSLEEVIGKNTAKLAQRMNNNTIKGEGDNR